MRTHILLCLFFFFFPVTSECHENGFTCNACCGIFPDNFLFRCQCCNLKLDSFCALYEPTREELHHFSHFHPLETVLLDKEVFPYICAACQTNCIGPNIYVQTLQLEFPQEVQRPCHPCLLTSGGGNHCHSRFYFNYSMV
jgi:hypothetical protein